MQLRVPAAGLQFPCYSHPDVLTAWLWNWYLIIDTGEIDIRNFEYFFSNVTCQSRS